MTSVVHIYTALLQPATGFVDRCGEIEFSGGWPGNRLLRCNCCHKPHPAKNVVVQCFYDGMYFWCAPDKGCKHPKIIAQKKRREFLNRSKAQKARYLKASYLREHSTDAS